MISKIILRRLVELACQAPSVHNTQPWIWRIYGNMVALFADHSRQLTADDPTGRDLVISCGAALDHFQYAAHALGWDTSVTRLPKGSGPDGPIALIRLRRGRPSATPAEDLAVLRNRCTDRRRFTSWPVPSSSVETLVDCARARDARACAVVDEEPRLRLELMTHQAHGIPPSGLPADEDPASDPWSHLGTGLMVETRALVESGDGVIVLGGDFDDPAAWLLTGEALSALWLEATRAGLSVVPLSLPVETETGSPDLRRVVLDGGLEPHILVRIGWQAIGRSQTPRTPRRTLSEVLWQ